MGKSKKKKKKRSLAARATARLMKGMLKLFLAFALITLAQVALFRFVNPPFTVNMVWERARHTLFDTPYVPARYQWRDLEAISPHLRQAVLASEDQRFLQHRGFDFQEIRVVVGNVVKGRRPRGASTITMQAARSLYLPFSRSIPRKLAEAWYTVLMELTWDKRRILEIYLNTVDWGTGLVGAQAGAQHYFSRDAGRLTAQQAALMAAILPSPHKWSPTRPGPRVRKRQNRIMRDMSKMPDIK